MIIRSNRQTESNPFWDSKPEVTRLIKWEFEYTLFAFQDELVDRLLSIKDKIFLKH
jgi:hypothetical protein